MEKSKGKIAVAVIGLFLGLFCVALVHAGYSYTVGYESGVIDAAYPLFNSDITWSMKVPVTLPPKSLYNPTDETIAGYQVSSLPTATTNDLSAVFEPFRDYYDEVLLKNGWKINTQYEADGAGGSLWGYTKGKNILIFTYTSTFLNQQPDQPVQCPCTLVFTIIGGTLK